MHLRVYRGCVDPAVVGEALERFPTPAVVYADVHDPTGVGILVASEDPQALAGPVLAELREEPFASLHLDPEFSMLGRTYGLGHEPDLEDALLHRPLRYALHEEWPWAVWYPLRRAGHFAQLGESDRRAILREHGAIGMAYGRADLAHDIRLACYGLDTNDNDFVIGLVGKDLHPLSAVVEAMRGTRQTAEFIERLGPFFVGRVVARHHPARG
jgi:chlorite dismutase